MSTETVTIYRDEYEKLNRDDIKLRTDLATLRGKISGLANMVRNYPDVDDFTIESVIHSLIKIADREPDTFDSE